MHTVQPQHLRQARRVSLSVVESLLRMPLQKGVPDALAFQQAAATLLKSSELRLRVIASLRAAALGFRELCAEYQVRQETGGQVPVFAMTLCGT